jgi:hypothetical protein
MKDVNHHSLELSKQSGNILALVFSAARSNALPKKLQQIQKTQYYIQHFHKVLDLRKMLYNTFCYYTFCNK